jgi:hypothetical protein
MRARRSASRAYDAVTSLVRSVVRTASVSVILNVLAVVTRPSRVRRFDRRNVISRPPGTRLSDAFSMSPRDAAPRGQNRVWRSVGDAAAKKSGSAPNFFWGASIGCEWIAKPKIGIRRAAFQTIRTLRRDTPEGSQGCPRVCRAGSDAWPSRHGEGVHGDGSARFRAPRAAGRQCRAVSSETRGFPGLSGPTMGPVWTAYRFRFASSCTSSRDTGAQVVTCKISRRS